MKPIIVPSTVILGNSCRANSGIGSTGAQVISKQILGILNVDNQGRVKEHQDIFFSLLKLLQTEIERKRNELGYNYVNYEARLIVSDEVFEQVFQEQILGDAQIRNIYEALIKIIDDENSKEIIRQRLQKEYFEDLLYESMDPSQVGYEILDLSNGGIEKSLGKKKSLVSDFFKKSVWFTSLKTRLGKKESTFLEELRSARSIDLQGNHFIQTNETKLKTIFENLRMVKDINLRDSSLHNLDEARFKIIFKSLGYVKSIDLRDNYLNELDEARLKIIFQNLKMIKSIDLRWNDLLELDEARLKIIFGNLGNAQKIYLTEPPEFIEKLLLLFPNLKGKIINQE